jgi:hypothetical protein
MLNREQEIFEANQCELSKLVKTRVDKNGTPTKFGPVAEHDIWYSRQGVEVASRFLVAKDRFLNRTKLPRWKIEEVDIQQGDITDSTIEVEEKPLKIADITAGIGGDAIVAAQLGAEVHAYEIEPLTYKILSHNAEVVGFRAYSEPAKLENLPCDLDVIFADPMRRKNGKRGINVSDYEPTIEHIAHLFDQYMEEIFQKYQELNPPQTGVAMQGPKIPQLLIKLSPATNQQEISEIFSVIEHIKLMNNSNYPSFWTKGQSVYKYSVDEDCVETVLRIFPCYSTVQLTQAIIINSAIGATNVLSHDNTSTIPHESGGNHTFDLEQSTHIVEPDPAIISSGLIEELLGVVKNLREKDYYLGQTAYVFLNLTSYSQSKVSSILQQLENFGTKAYRIHSVSDFKPKKITKEVQNLSQQLGFSGVEIKKRGVEVDPHKLQVQLNKSLPAGLFQKVLSILITRVGLASTQRRVVVLAERVYYPPSS